MQIMKSIHTRILRAPIGDFITLHACYALKTGIIRTSRIPASNAQSTPWSLIWDGGFWTGWAKRTHGAGGGKSRLHRQF
jgi:hypothetical protein